MIDKKRILAIEKLLDYSARVEADISEHDTGWFYQWSAAAEKLRNMDHDVEDAANAALIAAAPDLLAMLRRFEHSILSLDEIPPTFCALDMEQARKALAKADGTTPTFYIVAWNRRVNGISTDFYSRCDSLKNAKAFYSRVIAFDNLVTASIAAEIEGTDT